MIFFKFLLCSCVGMRVACAFTPRIVPKKIGTSGSTERSVTEAQNTAVEAFADNRLVDYQKIGIPIANSFISKPYKSHPLLRNQHFQTILGVFIRDSPGCSYIKKSNVISELVPVVKAIFEAIPSVLGLADADQMGDYWDKRERFDTPDGDFFDVDYKFQSSKMEGGGKGTVLIIHGLESNSNSSLCVNMARAYMERGMDVACINFRGCSGVPNNTLLQYHAGFVDDLYVFLEKWAERNTAPLYVSGFSLGANVAMKLLGELGLEAVTKYNIRGAAVSGAPFSLNFHWRQLLDDPFNRIVYAGSLMKSMKKKVEHITENYLDGNKETDAFDYWRATNAKNIPEIEDAMIAPLYGFKDKFDYYDQSASYPVLDYISVPTLVLNAADDPFFNREIFPFEKDCGGKSDGAPIKLVRTDYGGHLGHLFHLVDENDSAEKQVASFAPMELARFLDHVHTNLD